MNWSLVSHYYGADWASAACTLVGMVLLGNKKRSGFIFYLLACLAGLFFAVMAGSLPLTALNIALMAISVRGFLRWGK